VGTEAPKAGVLERFADMAKKARERIRAIDFKLAGWKEEATELVPKLRDARKLAFNTMREQLVPLEAAEQKIREEWKPILETFDQGKTFLDGKLARALAEEEEREKADRRRATEEAAASQKKVEEALARGAEATTPAERSAAVAEGQAALAEQEAARAAASVPVEKPKVTTSSGATAHAKTEYKFELLDITKVPEHLTYRALDEKLTAAAIKAMADRGENPAIAGLRIFPVTKATVRKGR